jgi:hypothetical protein
MGSKSFDQISQTLCAMQRLLDYRRLADPPATGNLQEELTVPLHDGL